MGQNESSIHPQSPTYLTPTLSTVNPIRTVHHEGILKLQTTPFINSIQIDSGASPLFLENAQTSLQDILNSRLYTNRLFPYQDVRRLIQNIVYTLAYFQNLGIAYRDLSPFNIYYCSNKFKILPNELITETVFERASKRYHKIRKEQASEEQFMLVSPQMIIALRYNEQQLDDLQIFNKSNVFILGMILLQACTMLPSSECFDQNNYAIFNKVITERLELVEEHYDSKIARIIANMIDYDYSQRMLMKEIAVWINREFSEQQQSNQQFQSKSQFPKKKLDETKSRILIHNQSVSIGDQAEQVHETSGANHKIQVKHDRCFSKSNMVYMDRYNDIRQEQLLDKHYEGPKNSVYLNFKQQFHHEDHEITHQSFNPNHKTQCSKRKDAYMNPHVHTPYKRTPQYLQSEIPKFTQEKHYLGRHHLRDSEIKSLCDQQYKQDYYHYRLQDLQQPNQLIQESHDPYHFNQARALRQIKNLQASQTIENKNNPYLNNDRKEDAKYERRLSQANQPRTLQPQLCQPENNQMRRNKFYPSVDDLENSNLQTEKKRMFLHSEVNYQKNRNSDSRNMKESSTFNSKQSEGHSSINDGSINRIKFEIEKSRKLIEEFRKSEGISN